MKLPTDCQHLTDRSPTDHRQSTDSRSTVGQQISCRKLSFQKNLNKSVGQLSVRCWSTVGQLSADRSPTVGRQSADRLPTVGRQITNSRPTVGEGSCSSQLPKSEVCSVFLSVLNNIILCVYSGNTETGYTPFLIHPINLDKSIPFIIRTREKRRNKVKRK